MMINRVALIAVLALSLLAAPLVVEAQEAAKVARIGYLVPNRASNPHLGEALRQGLRDLGYVEGRNLVIEYRDAEGQHERLPSLAAELVALKVDVIVASNTPAVLAAKQTTRTLGVSRVAVLWQPGAFSERTEKDMLKGAEAAARSLGVRLQFVEARSPADFDRAFSDMTRARARALTVLPSTMFLGERSRLVDLAAKNRLPAVYPPREFVDAGGLMSYGSNVADSFRRTATYVDKILKGAKPGDLPIEQPTKFELLINLKTAKALGLTIPPSVLGRADHIIE